MSQIKPYKRCKKCGALIVSGSLCEDCKPMTNGDKIRAMTDEELGFWKASPVCDSCAWFENRECDNDCTKYNCFNGAIEWMRKEASEDAAD